MNESTKANKQHEIANLTGTLTGVVDGVVEDVSALATSGGNTYTDAAVNAKITAINLQIKELFTKINQVVDQLSALGISRES